MTIIIFFLIVTFSKAKTPECGGFTANALGQGQLVIHPNLWESNRSRLLRTILWHVRLKLLKTQIDVACLCLSDAYSKPVEQKPDSPKDLVLSDYKDRVDS